MPVLKLSSRNENTDGVRHTIGGQMDGHTDNQHRAVIPHYYCGGWGGEGGCGYKKRIISVKLHTNTINKIRKALLR